MQYDLDIKGPQADIFKRIRKILLSYPQIKELKNAKQTSYSVLLREMIEESFVLGMEAYEMRQLRATLNKR